MASAGLEIKAGLGLLWTALCLALAAATPAGAASFQPHRGINMDAWTTWPKEAEWNDPAVLLPFPEWRRTVGEADLARLKDAGLDFVRIPVDPAPFLSPVAAPLHDRLYAQVLQAVRLINAAGLKAIVDMHLMPSNPDRAPGMGSVMDDAKQFDAYTEVIRRMAHTLRSLDPSQVAFEPMNEPIVDCEDGDKKLWPERQKQLWAAARAAAPQLTIVLTGACYSSAEGLAKLDPKDFPDDNLLWTFHSYAPFVLTHQGATWAGDFIPYVTGLPFPPSSIPQAELDKRLDAIRAKIKAEAPWSRRAGLLSYLDEQVETVNTPQRLEAVMDEPFGVVAGWAQAHGVDAKNILLGEFGMIRQEYGNNHVTPPADRAAYVKTMAGEAEKHGFAWSAWSYGGAFGIVDAFNGEKAEPDVLDAIRALPPFPSFALRQAAD